MSENLSDQVKTQLGKLIALQAPVLLQMVQLWSVLSRLGQRSESSQGLSEVPYLETWAELAKHSFCKKIIEPRMMLLL